MQPRRPAAQYVRPLMITTGEGGRVEADHYTEDFDKETDRSIILAMLEINYCPYCGGKARKADDRDSYCEACDLTFYVVLPDEYRIED